MLEDAPTLSQTFASDNLGMQLEKVANLISVRGETESERDVFVVVDGGYDTHLDLTAKVTGLLLALNNNLETFVNEMKYVSCHHNLVDPLRFSVPSV